MKLWTAQRIEAYDNLIQNGVHRCSETVIEDFAECWKPAYDWMAQKMVEKIGAPPEGVRYPIWFWYKWNGRHHQPDLRARSSFGPKGQELVLLEVEIPDNRILLSDFDAWHSVLNNCHAYHDARTEAEYQELDRWLDSLSEADRQHEIKKSWDSIFEIAPFENDFCRNGVWVQATAWEIKAEDVVKTRPFIC